MWQWRGFSADHLTRVDFPALDRWSLCEASDGSAGATAKGFHQAAEPQACTERAVLKSKTT